MIDVSIVKSGSTNYAVKSFLKKIGEDRYNFKILYVYEIDGAPDIHTFRKKKTIYDSSEDSSFNTTTRKQLFKDITTYIGQKYRISYLVI